MLALLSVGHVTFGGVGGGTIFAPEECTLANHLVQADCAHGVHQWWLQALRMLIEFDGGLPMLLMIHRALDENSLGFRLYRDCIDNGQW